MRFYQRSQISVLYAVCGPPVLAPDRERIRPPHINCLPIVTCRGTATEGGILACILSPTTVELVNLNVFKKVDWSDIYDVEEVKEDLPPRMPEPRG